MKKTTINLQIPTPCREDWNSFSPTEKGRFCGSCQKVVIDFTQLTEVEIKNYFLNSQENTCGRFRQDQLTTYPILTLRSSTCRASLVALLLLLVSKFTSAQISSKPIPVTQEQIDKKQVAQSDTAIHHMIIRGVVRDEEKNPLPGVNIVVKGSAIGTISDGEGSFELYVPHPKPSETIMASFIGMISFEQIIKASVLHQLEISLKYDMTALQGVVIVGGVVSTRKISPRRWWWNFKSIFK